MANSLNTVALVGNLTRDPELKQLPSGAAVTELSIAVNERVKRGEEWEDYGNFFDVTVWGRQAENAVKYLAKGRPVAVQGRLRQERWENENGDKRSKVKVVAHTIQFLGSRENGSQGASGGNPQPEHTPAASQDDLPF